MVRLYAKYIPIHDSFKEKLIWPLVFTTTILPIIIIIIIIMIIIISYDNDNNDNDKLGVLYC